DGRKQRLRALTPVVEKLRRCECSTPPDSATVLDGWLSTIWRLAMGSMEALAKSDRFESLRTISVPSLIVAGYLALIASAFWDFTKTSAPVEEPIEDRANMAAGTLICRCYPEVDRESADNSLSSAPRAHLSAEAVEAT